MPAVGVAESKDLVEDLDGVVFRFDHDPKGNAGAPHVLFGDERRRNTEKSRTWEIHFETALSGKRKRQGVVCSTRELEAHAFRRIGALDKRCPRSVTSGKGQDGEDEYPIHEVSATTRNALHSNPSRARALSFVAPSSAMLSPLRTRFCPLRDSSADHARVAAISGHIDLHALGLGQRNRRRGNPRGLGRVDPGVIVLFSQELR